MIAAKREYCGRLQEGELQPDLLFCNDPELAARVRNHPSLQWKALNARQHSGSGPLKN
ncbi:MAG: hypothetical protein V3T72_04725 [Thermoanaerobaculia bacterium]